VFSRGALGILWRKQEVIMIIAIIGVAYVVIVLILTRSIHGLHEKEERMREIQALRISERAQTSTSNPRAAA